MGGRMYASYLTYATINGKTMPINPSIIPSMLDFSGCEAKSCDGVKKLYYIPKPCICTAAHDTIDSVIDKPLEVLAMQLEGENGIRPKWQILLLRDGEGSGFIHDDAAHELSRQQ